MSTIRPYTPAAAPLPGREPARAPAQSSKVMPTKVAAAQQAFFRTADETAARADPQSPPRRVEPRPLDRLPRPGSLLDIKV
jgi:hypothetical protein